RTANQSSTRLWRSRISHFPSREELLTLRAERISRLLFGMSRSPAFEEKNMINRLFHVFITVADIEAALQFYCGVLELKSIGALRNEKAPGAVLGFPGQEIEIHANHLVGKNNENATVIDLIEFVSPKTVVAAV